MIKVFKFNDIRKYLEEKNDTAVLDAFDSLADAAMIFSPIIFGPQLLPLFGLLDVKDRLFGLGKKVLDFIVSKREPDSIYRSEQLKNAYALICYTAYFESLNDILPNSVIKLLKLKFSKKSEIDDAAVLGQTPEQGCRNFDFYNDLPYVDLMLTM